MRDISHLSQRIAEAATWRPNQLESREMRLAALRDADIPDTPPESRHSDAYRIAVSQGGTEQPGNGADADQEAYEQRRGYQETGGVTPQAQPVHIAEDGSLLSRMGDAGQGEPEH
ncbi:hypothetical protein PUG81_24840 [Erwiniaceae bacterium L1_54_6]|nr:hypothetical protein [Erwiniaceae bacterium L1_54_6]